LLDRLPPALEARRRRRRPDLRPRAHREAPVGDAAIGVGLRDRGERLGRFEIPERVEQRDGALERLLDGGVARDGEAYLSDLLRLVGGDGDGDETRHREGHDCCAHAHGMSPHHRYSLACRITAGESKRLISSISWLVKTSLASTVPWMSF